MYIKNIEWYDSDSEEGMYEVSDSIYTVVCYAWKEDYQKGDLVSDAIVSLCASNITISEDQCFKVERLSFFEHKLTGILCDNRTAIRVGGICIKLDTAVPTNLCDGNWISVTMSRIDL